MCFFQETMIGLFGLEFQESLAFQCSVTLLEAFTVEPHPSVGERNTST